MKIVVASAVVVMMLVGGGMSAFAGSAEAGDCDRYIQGEGTQLLINHSCVMERGLPPIFVQKNKDGRFELVVPNREGDDQAIWQATQEWLSNPRNLDGLNDQISRASELAKIDPEVFDGNISQLEFVNYSVGQWLKDFGAVDAIVGTALPQSQATESQTVMLQQNPQLQDPSTPTACRDIPICTACRIYYCGYIGGDLWCGCNVWGQSCCVINISRQ